MAEPARDIQWLRRGPALVVSLLLLSQIVLFYLVSTAEYLPPSPLLNTFFHELGGWSTVREIAIESEVQDLLKADETMNRVWRGPGGEEVSLFVAYFRTQRAGVSPHSPKVCLPGSGWVPERSSTVPVTIPEHPEPIVVNRYTVSRGIYRSVVYYWYQTAHRVIASEYSAKVYLMLDGVRYRRSDTSLVRVVVPVREREREQEADRIAKEFKIGRAHV